MKTLGVIPSRYGSMRFPGKSLALICGKPLVVWVYEAACRARRLDAVVVATDDERIVEAVTAAGGEAVMTRADHPSGTDRIAEAACGYGADVIVNIQGDEPLVKAALLDELVETMVDDKRWDMATAATPIRTVADLCSPSVVKVVWGADHRALYFSRATIPHVRDAAVGELTPAWRHLGIYAYRRDFLDRFVATPPSPLEEAEKLEQLRALHIGGRMAVIETDDDGIGVDTPADRDRVEAIMRDALASSATEGDAL